jgi:hypothetical protein
VPVAFREEGLIAFIMVLGGEGREELGAHCL